MAATADPTRQFLAARDFLPRHREDYSAAYDGFIWPRPDRFNWALDWFDHLATRDRAGHTALWIVEQDGSESRFSIAELSARSNRVANWLRDQGVSPDDRIIVMLGNQVELWETALAAMKLRAVVIPATTLLGPADLGDRVDRGAARHVVVRAADTASGGWSSPNYPRPSPARSAGSNCGNAPRVATSPPSTGKRTTHERGPHMNGVHA